MMIEVASFDAQVVHDLSKVAPDAFEAGALVNLRTLAQGLDDYVQALGQVEGLRDSDVTVLAHHLGRAVVEAAFALRVASRRAKEVADE